LGSFDEPATVPGAMPSSREPVLLHHVFAFTGDADLNAQIAAHRAQHERAHGQILAMHGRRSLGPGKVQITFRVVEK
jgi:hypothetical protein